MQWNLQFLFLFLVLGFLSRKGRWLSFGAVVGLSTLALRHVNQSQNVVLPSGQSERLAIVQDYPSYPHPGEIRLALKLSGGVLALCKAVDLPWRNIHKVGIYSEFFLKAKFRKVKPSWNPFSYENRLWRSGYNYTCKIKLATTPSPGRPGTYFRLKKALIHHLRDRLGDREELGLFIAMLIGGRNLTSDRTEMAFKRTGLAHLLVVSGFQVMLVFHLVYSLMLFLLRSSSLLSTRLSIKSLAILIGVVASLIFITFVGWEESCMRAGLAILLVVTANLSERSSGLLNSILASLLLIALIWPGCYLEPSLQLTYSALTGIWLATRDKKASKLKTYFKLNLYVWLLTTLVSLAWFGVFSPLGILFNLTLATPLALIVCYGGLSSLALFLIGIDRRAVLLEFILQGLYYVRELVVYFASFDMLVLEVAGIGQILLLLAMTLLLVFIVCKEFQLCECFELPWRKLTQQLGILKAT